MSNLVDLAPLLHDTSGIVSLLVVSAVKTTVLLSFVAALCLLVRRRQAATRHLLWTLALCGSLALPLLSSSLNIWQVRVLPDSETMIRFVGASILTGGVEESEHPPETRAANNPTFLMRASGNEPPRTSASAHQATRQAEDASVLTRAPGLPRAARWTLCVSGVWLTGAALLLIRLMVGVIGTWSLMNRGTEFDAGERTNLFSTLLKDFKLTGRVRLLRSEHTLMPIVCGVLRPTVLLPASADDWSEERRRVVLLHELAHVARRDCLTQVTTQIACALYWFNPLVWYAARQSRVERERACDDYVLGGGAKPSDYAHHLLEIARSLGSRRTFDVSTIATVAMARRSQLEDRLLAILDSDGKTLTAPRVLTMGSTALVCFTVLSIAAVQPTTRAARNIQNSIEIADAQSHIARDSSSVPNFAAGSAMLSETADQEAARSTVGQEQKRKGENKDEVLDSIVMESLEADIERDVAHDIAQDVGRDVAVDTTGLRSTVEAQVQVQMQMQIPRVNPQINIRIDSDFNLRDRGEDDQDERSERDDQSSDYSEDLASVGYTNLSFKQLTQLKTHGVTAAYVKTMRDAGLSKLSADQLLAFRVHEVTPEFVAGMRAVGYPDLSPNQLTQARITGVTPQFVRATRSRLGELSITQLVALKRTGIIKGTGDK